MGMSPKIPQTKLPPPAPSPFDENILLARKRARRKAMMAFGVNSATLTSRGSVSKSTPALPTIAGSITGSTNG